MGNGKMPALKEKQFKSPEHNYNRDYYEMKKHQAFNSVLKETQKKKPQREWTIRDQEFEDALWAS
jgi:hypothetical protein